MQFSTGQQGIIRKSVKVEGRVNFLDHKPDPSRVERQRVQKVNAAMLI